MPASKRDEATGTATSVEYNGHTYTVPPADDWDIDVLEAIDNEKMTHALKALLGDDQYAEFRKHNRKVKEMGEFMQKATEAVNAGN